VAGRAYALLGPTASGKSRLALEVAARAPVEIVSIDSAQVYRGMDIGTAKPSPDEQRRVRHHLIDVVDPDSAYSAGRWRADAIAAVSDILSRGRIPFLVGGTMLYYRTLVAGLAALPQADPQVRVALDARARAEGWPALHAELARVDPASAGRIQPNDSQRIQRALEVWQVTGEPLSVLQGRSPERLPFFLKTFALIPQERSALHARIEERFDAMLRAGLVEELTQLRDRYRLSASMPSMRCVGYRQAWEFLEGKLDASELRSRGIAATRQLAKRQLTWLRSFEEVEPVDADADRLAARLYSG
jgi:tRNA dimethylallyltransferase